VSLLNRFIISLVILLCVFVSCKKRQIVDYSDKITISFIDEEISYYLGNPLNINVEISNISTDSINIPVQFWIFGLVLSNQQYTSHLYIPGKGTIGPISLAPAEKKLIDLEN
jgi:hypothetical protein